MTKISLSLLKISEPYPLQVNRYRLMLYMKEMEPQLSYQTVHQLM